jgi:hypothetical protein
MQRSRCCAGASRRNSHCGKGITHPRSMWRMIGERVRPASAANNRAPARTHICSCRMVTSGFWGAAAAYACRGWATPRSVGRMFGERVRPASAASRAICSRPHLLLPDGHIRPEHGVTSAVLLGCISDFWKTLECHAKGAFFATEASVQQVWEILHSAKTASFRVTISNSPKF